ncbi:MAG: MarR family transcriptional regulator [Erysipelotrichaceae bacterium]
MINNVKLALDKIFHDSAVAELRLLNNGIGDKTLTYNDILYLNIIEAHSGEYTASNIADMLYVSRPSVTQKINELEKKGYIYKVQSNTDKRVYKLFTNKDDQSKRYYEVTDKTNDDILNKLSKEYSDTQIDLFCEMTEKICEIILQETKKDKSFRGV